jgi:hypothetical protein
MEGSKRCWSDLGMDKKGDIQEVRWWISRYLAGWMVYPDGESCDGIIPSPANKKRGKG